MSEEPRDQNLPPMVAGDVYVYAHSNGGLSIVGHDGHRDDVTLAEAQETTRGVQAAGATVWVCGDNAPLSIEALHLLGAVADPPLAAFAAPVAPQSWPSGTDALISAAAHGSHDILDDLLARGANVLHRDAAGSAALHHAAATGNVHAVEALAAHGAVISQANDKGATPLKPGRRTRSPSSWSPR